MTAGWAGTAAAREQLLAYTPTGPGDDEPAYAIADAWTLPDPAALPLDVCDRVLAAARASRIVVRTGNGAYHLPDLDAADEEAIIARFGAANALWWQLDLDEWHIGVKSYRCGERHPEHQDLHAGGGGTRKFAGVAQLSDPDSYRGGDLLVRFADHRVVMPRARGALVAFPAWTLHEVSPVVRGERWSLICNANGPKLR